MGRIFKIRLKSECDHTLSKASYECDVEEKPVLGRLAPPIAVAFRAVWLNVTGHCHLGGMDTAINDDEWEVLR